MVFQAISKPLGQTVDRPGSKCKNSELASAPDDNQQER